MLNLDNTVDVRRWLVTVVLVMVALVLGGGTVLAGHNADAVASYTGCLTKGGAVTEVAVGDVPLRPCGPDHTEVHLSGGDLTAVAAGDGLTGGASNGAATLALAPSHQLPQTCTNAQVAKWDGTGWSCAADDAGQQYSAGNGLELNGTEFSLDRDYRLPQSCKAGQAAGFGPTATSLGDWQCSQYALASETCPSGQFARATDDDGALLCAPPASAGAGGGSTAYVAVERNPVDGSDSIGILNRAGDFEMVRLDLPAGTYVLLASGTVSNDFLHPDDYVASCSLRADGVTLQFATVSNTTADSGGVDESLSLTSAASLPAGGTVRVTCRTIDSDGMVGERFRLVAIPVGALG